MVAQVARKGPAGGEGLNSIEQTCFVLTSWIQLGKIWVYIFSPYFFQDVTYSQYPSGTFGTPGGLLGTLEDSEGDDCVRRSPGDS